MVEKYVSRYSILSFKILDIDQVLLSQDAQ